MSRQETPQGRDLRAILAQAEPHPQRLRSAPDLPPLRARTRILEPAPTRPRPFTGSAGI